MENDREIHVQEIAKSTEKSLLWKIEEDYERQFELGNKSIKFILKWMIFVNWQFLVLTGLSNFYSLSAFFNLDEDQIQIYPKGCYFLSRNSVC